MDENASQSKNNYGEPKTKQYLAASWSSGPGHNFKGVRHRYMRSKSLNFPAEVSNKEIRIIRERLLRTHTSLQPSELRNFNRSQKLTLTCLAMVDFMGFCSMSIMAPFFPKEAAEKGMTDTLTGFVFSFYAVVMALSSPVFGKILPAIGPKFVLMSGIFVSGVCNLLFGFLEYIDDFTQFTVFCFLIRGVEALGGSAFCTASYLFVVNTFPSNVGVVIGLLETFVGLGMSIGPAIGGFLYLIGGFQLPFYVLGIMTLLLLPLNFYLLPNLQEYSIEKGGGSPYSILKIPTAIVICLVVIIISSIWGFLDPTLEPHLRQFNISTEKIGLIFLMFSALYGITSPGWGWLADKIQRTWLMMFFGLVLCTIGLLLLGPSPYLPFIKGSIWLDLVALATLGISVSLALMPTFGDLLSCALESGCRDSLTTYGVVAGMWSGMYSLGEVIGPSLGGIFLQHFGFPMASTIMAASTLILAVIVLIFFAVQGSESSEIDRGSDSGISASWNSACSRDDLECAEETLEKRPLLKSKDSDHRLYTVEKVMYYEQSRKQDKRLGDVDTNQLTDVRGTVSITASGACEV